MDNQFLKLLIRLPGINQRKVIDVVHSYNVRYDSSSLLALRERALQLNPALREGTTSVNADLREVVQKSAWRKRSEFDSNTWRCIDEFRGVLTHALPTERFSLHHRVSTVEQVESKLEKNGIRALFDIVGFQIEPRYASDIIEAIEVCRALEPLVTFNTFPFLESDFATTIGPSSSSYYRAIHFYLDIGCACVEVQIRTPAIHEWSKIHHATHYKPLVQTTKEERDLVMRFGEMANWVDFRDLCRA